jgi:hypothetical protein
VGRIVLTTHVRAPIATCFDLARDVGAHCQTASFTGERVLAPGRTEGLLELGEVVVFEGRHFGVRWRMSARIVELDVPVRFVDEGIDGVFRQLRHVHEFSHANGITTMVDTVEWRAPLGFVGRLADRLGVERHLVWFLTKKQGALKALAEGSSERQTCTD